MRFLVTGGGTGGHVYPALAVVEAVLGDPGFSTKIGDIAWVGTPASVEERLVARTGLAFYPVAAAAIRGMGARAVVRSAFRLLSGFRQARTILRAFRPNVVLATGGYVCVPLVLAARSLGCPVMIFLPDIEPGLAVKSLSHLAQKVAVSFSTATAHFPRGRAIVTGYPVRQALYNGDRRRSRAALGLDEDLPVLLVFGGSRGAHSINEAVRNLLEPLLGMAQLVHISGYEDYEFLDTLRAQLPAALSRRYHLYAYLNEEMVDALAAADLVVARAGAATLGEFPAAGLPALLVPYPYAGQHQQANAEFLVGQGAALAVPDHQLADLLLPTVEQLLTDRERLERMGSAARASAVPDAARTVAKSLLALASSEGENKEKRP